MQRILVIEDEAQTRNVFLRCLEFEGFQAYSASNGSEGIATAQSRSPDLIVCDIMMPDMDGYSVLATLRRSPITAAIPLIFLTAKVTMADLRRGMELGADDYLTKPCTVEQFLAAITSRLQRHAELLRRDRVTAPTGADVVAHGVTAPPEFFPTMPSLQAVFDFIEAHYHQAINLADVARSVGYSPAYLTNLVQSQTGRSVKRWIIERRMAQARHMLAQTQQPVCAIAQSAGYNDAGYFTRQFRKLHGVSPQVWREQSVA